MIPQQQAGSTLYAGTLNSIIDRCNGLGMPTDVDFVNTPNGTLYINRPTLSPASEAVVDDPIFLRSQVRSMNKLEKRTDVSSSLSTMEDYYFVNLGSRPDVAFRSLQYEGTPVHKILFVNTKEPNKKMDGQLCIGDYGETYEKEGITYLCAGYDGYVNTGIYALSSGEYSGGFVRTLGEYQISGEGGQVSNVISTEYFWLFTDDLGFNDGTDSVSARICDILEISQLCSYQTMCFQPMFCKTDDGLAIQLAVGTQLLGGNGDDNNPWKVDKVTGTIERAWAQVGTYCFDTGIIQALSGLNWLVMDMNTMSADIDISAKYTPTKASIPMFEWDPIWGTVKYYNRQPVFPAFRRYTI